MLIGIPTPGGLVGMARSTVGWAYDSAATVAAAPQRVLGLVDSVEDLLKRVTDVVDRADELVERTAKTVEATEELLTESNGVASSAAETVREAGRISASAEKVVIGANGISDRASDAVDKTVRITERAEELLAAYEPAAKRAAPMLERFVNDLTQKEVDAAIRLVDEMPVLTEHLLSDILPILRTLDRVGPEIHELLEVTHDVRRAIVGIPGFRYFRRRGEERVTEEEVDTPDDGHFGPTPPPSS